MKYEITDNSKIINGRTVYRIKALIDIQTTLGLVKANSIGGYIENERNLSQTDNCWVDSSAAILENALVKDNAYLGDEVIVANNAIVEGNAKVLYHTKVLDTALISGDAHIDSAGAIYGDAHVGNKSYIYWNTDIYDTNHIYNFTFNLNDTEHYITIYRYFDGYLSTVYSDELPSDCLSMKELTAYITELLANISDNNIIDTKTIKLQQTLVTILKFINNLD